MSKKICLFGAVLCAFTLTGCLNREQADSRLSKACVAAVNVFLDETQKIETLKGADFSASPEGPDFRHVTIHTVIMDGWLETENDYECVFQEGFGFLNSGYTASIYQVHVGDDIYGSAGGQIQGDAQDHLKLNEAVRKSLYGK